MNNVERLIQTAAEYGATKALVNLGLHAGEISQRKALSIYGKWFAAAVNAGRLNPCRVEEGRAGTRFYSVTEILSLKTYDSARADLKL